MKTKPALPLRSFWLMLTEVPGWPDAPWLPRLRRALPVLLPCAAMAVIAVWNLAVHAPRVRAETAEVLPLLALENEVATLQFACSDQQVADLAERAAAASRLLLGSRDEAGAFLRGLKKEAADRGFESTFVSSDVSDEPVGDETRISYIPVRGKLIPVAANTEPFAPLLALLDRFASLGKRIDLMRVAIRADEQKWQTIEVNFRLVCPAVHEKAPQ